MKRDMERDLVNWKERKDRMPLLLRGARQVGKSYIVEEFGKKAFKNIVIVNFEFRCLMQNACGLQAEITLTNNFFQINTGAVIEQFVGQELRAHSDSYLERGLFFWARDKKKQLG